MAAAIQALIDLATAVEDLNGARVAAVQAINDQYEVDRAQLIATFRQSWTTNKSDSHILADAMYSKTNALTTDGTYVAVE
jgi:hypothetical protein